MAAVVFDELYCMVGALGFVGIIAAAVDDILRKFAVYRGNLFTDNNLSVFNGSVVFKYRVVGQWIANQSASRPATKLSNCSPASVVGGGAVALGSKSVSLESNVA